MASESYLGAVFLFAGNFAPRSFALCNGALLSVAQNTALFSILGTTYGGNGQTTFALPDLRGRGPIGVGQGPGLPMINLGDVSGSQNVTLTSANMPTHTHAATVTIKAAADGRGSSDSPAGAFLDSVSGVLQFTTASDGTTMNPGMAVPTIQPAGNGLPFSVADPYLGLNYIICTQGIFPSRN